MCVFPREQQVPVDFNLSVFPNIPPGGICGGVSTLKSLVVLYDPGESDHMCEMGGVMINQILLGAYQIIYIGEIMFVCPNFPSLWYFMSLKTLHLPASAPSDPIYQVMSSVSFPFPPTLLSLLPSFLPSHFSLFPLPP